MCFLILTKEYLDHCCQINIFQITMANLLWPSQTMLPCQRLLYPECPRVMSLSKVVEDTAYLDLIFVLHAFLSMLRAQHMLEKPWTEARVYCRPWAHHRHMESRVWNGWGGLAWRTSARTSMEERWSQRRTQSIRQTALGYWRGRQ